MSTTEAHHAAAREWLHTNGFITQTVDEATLAALIARVEAEAVARMEREVTCVWCGHQFKSTIQSQAEHLYEHAKACEKHPVYKAEAQANAAYHERNQLVALLSKIYPSVIGFDPQEPDWPVVFIHLPSGQVSWHITPDERHSIFAHIYDESGKWDGHDDAEKWLRVKVAPGVKR